MLFVVLPIVENAPPLTAIPFPPVPCPRMLIVEDPPGVPIETEPPLTLIAGWPDPPCIQIVPLPIVSVAQCPDVQPTEIAALFAGARIV